MLVWLLTEGTYSDYSVRAVFTDQVKAEAALAEYKKLSCDEVRLEEWDADVETTEVVRDYWESCIDLATGEIVRRWENKIWADPHLRCVPCPRQELVRGRALTYEWWRSYVSQEHADKLAVESRQKFLVEIKDTYTIVKEQGKYYVKPIEKMV